MQKDDFQYFVQGVVEQNRRILAKTITVIESSLPSRQELGRKIVDRLIPHTGKAVRLGITGVPGAGKSTFIESLGMFLIKKGHRVAVLAVDPSSSRSGGSILADKTRMEQLSLQEAAFIRPSPAGRTLGGVARKTRETMLVCEAAGYDVLIIETVGVGQSEITVASMVDFFLVLMISGAGDELQGIKKGVLELADGIAVNKADGDNVEKAEKARHAYETALHYLTPSSPVWTPPVLKCSALEMTGIKKIWDVVLDHRQKLAESGELQEKRSRQAVDWMWALVEDGLKQRFYNDPNVKKNLQMIKKDVERGLTTPTIAAYNLLFFLDNNQ